MKGAVLFDVDGTLVDSNDAHASAWAEACSEFGIARGFEFFQPLIGMGGDRILPLIDPSLPADEKRADKILARRMAIFKSKYLPALKPTSGARQLVERARYDGLCCVIASSAKPDELDPLLAVAGVADLIDIKTTSDDAGKSKPAPDIVETALKKVSTGAERAVFIGDTPYDVRSARSAGVQIIAVRCGGWRDTELSGAVAVYDDPADIVAHYDGSALQELAKG